jgi:hypothetical protein
VTTGHLQPSATRQPKQFLCRVVACRLCVVCSSVLCLRLPLPLLLLLLRAVRSRGGDPHSRTAQHSRAEQQRRTTEERGREGWTGLDTRTCCRLSYRVLHLSVAAVLRRLRQSALAVLRGAVAQRRDQTAGPPRSGMEKGEEQTHRGMDMPHFSTLFLFVPALYFASSPATA